MKGKSSHILAAVAFVVFVDMLGIGLILPVMPRLIGEIAQTSLDRPAEIGGLLTFAYAGMQFLCAPFIGGLSDRARPPCGCSHPSPIRYRGHPG